MLPATLVLAALLTGQNPAATPDQSAAVAAQQTEPPKEAPAGSDAPAEAKKPPTPPHAGVRALLDGLKEDFLHLPSAPNLYIAIAGGGLALAAHPADQNFNRRLISHDDLVNTAFEPGKIVGQTPVMMGAAIATYVYGRGTDQPKVSHIGMDLLRAQIVDQALTEALKLSTHRERPNHSNHQSFPSGHASITFASATVIERHLGWRESLLGYSIAAYVAASRLHDNRHYLSDVLFGAAVGALSGRAVTQHGREHWTLVPVNVPGGAAIMATRNLSSLNSTAR